MSTILIIALFISGFVLGSQLYMPKKLWPHEFGPFGRTIRFRGPPKRMHWILLGLTLLTGLWTQAALIFAAGWGVGMVSSWIGTH